MPKKVTFSDDTKGSRFDFATPRAESIKPSYTVTRTRLEDQILEKLKLAEASANRLRKM